MSAPQAKLFTAEQYLAWEEKQPCKNEYLDGEIIAMAGGSDRHVTTVGNVFAILRNHLRGGPCRAYCADMKLHVATANAFFYPDVLVTCDERDQNSAYYKSHPSLLVEVLSPSTAAYDRGGKFACYRQLPSLEEYLLIDPASFSADLFRHDGDGHWMLYPCAGTEQVALRSVSLSLPLAAIFEDVEPEARSNLQIIT